MIWRLAVDPRARKQLRKIPKDYAERILDVISSLSSNPFAGDIEKMEGQHNVWRRRVGDYRIFYELDQAQRLVHVFKIKRRTSSTY